MGLTWSHCLLSSKLAWHKLAWATGPFPIFPLPSLSSATAYTHNGTSYLSHSPSPPSLHRSKWMLAMFQNALFIRFRQQENSIRLAHISQKLKSYSAINTETRRNSSCRYEIKMCLQLEKNIIIDRDKILKCGDITLRTNRLSRP